MTIGNSVRFGILAAAATLFVMLVFLLLPSPVRFPAPLSLQWPVSIASGVALALCYVRAFPDRPVTVRAVLRSIPIWAYIAFAGLVLWSGMDQGLNPLQVVGTVCISLLLVAGVPWVLWLLYKDAFAAFARLLRRL